MSEASFYWMGRSIPYREGESIASALEAAGVMSYGLMPTCEARFFCGIGACQGCLVRVEGRVVEACLAPAAERLQVEPAGGMRD